MFLNNRLGVLESVLVMYSAQVPDLPLRENDYAGDENMDATLVEDLAKDIAQLTQSWGPR